MEIPNPDLSPAQRERQKKRDANGLYLTTSQPEGDSSSLDRSRAVAESLRPAQDTLAEAQARALLDVAVATVARDNADSDKVMFVKSPITGTLTNVVPVYANGNYGRMLTLERLADGYSDDTPPAFTFDQFEALFDPATVTRSEALIAEENVWQRQDVDKKHFTVRTADLLAGRHILPNPVPAEEAAVDAFMDRFANLRAPEGTDRLRVSVSGDQISDVAWTDPNEDTIVLADTDLIAEAAALTSDGIAGVYGRLRVTSSGYIDHYYDEEKELDQFSFVLPTTTKTGTPA